MQLKYLSEIAVAVDVLLLVTILQLIVLDVEPKSLHDAGSCLCVHTKQTGQPWVQLILRGLGKNIGAIIEGLVRKKELPRQTTLHYVIDTALRKGYVHVVVPDGQA